MAGDMVVVTAFDQNPLASLVLGHGRKFCGLVAVPAELDKAEKEVDTALTDAMKHRWFADLCKDNVYVGGSTLPACVPSFNVSAAANQHFFDHRSGYDSEDEDADETSNLEVAKMFAEEHGLEIKVLSQICGICLFFLVPFALW